MLLDFDATDDHTQGEQEGSYYHGYYRQHIYHPLIVFDGESGHLITTLSRAGNTYASYSSVALFATPPQRTAGLSRSDRDNKLGAPKFTKRSLYLVP